MFNLISRKGTYTKKREYRKCPLLISRKLLPHKNVDIRKRPSRQLKTPHYVLLVQFLFKLGDIAGA